MESNIFKRIDLAEVRYHNDWLRYLGKARLRVLFVTDARFTDTNSVYQYMQGKTLGCTKISVKRALYNYGNGAVSINNSPGPNDPHFSNFKFTSTNASGNRILDDFDVMYIFAVDSGNPSTVQDSELAALHEWMNAGHGVFATGDHSTLGQRLASRIPRVGTMRKWTSADGVPPGGGYERIDTNQPDPNIPGEVNGTETIPNSAQSDAYPQKITVLPFTKINVGPFRQIHYPHEILCHPTYGAINVMPDHPHEGECVKPNSIDLAATVKFSATAANSDEYPEVAGTREKPRIIATGRNSHEYDLAKGDVKPYTFDMISVYDGHKANVGRVVVDSTWHHWYGMNIDGLEAAGGKNWAKIGRYFLNIAKYLAPKGVYKNRCTLDIIDAQFAYPFIEEYVYDKGPDDIYSIGVSLHESLTLRWGKCGVLKFVLRHICDYKPWLCKLLEREQLPGINPRDPVCLTCPPHDVLVNYVIGGIAIQTKDIRELLKARFSGDAIKRDNLDVDEIDAAISKGVEQGVSEFLEKLEKDLKTTQRAWLSEGG